MKKLIALLFLTAVSATAQVQLLDSTTPHTNNATTSAQINVPSKGWTNVPYSTTNYIYIIYGDGLPAAATTKLNSNLVYITNQLALALQLPNQINTNWQSAVATQSNRINIVIINLATVSNNLATTMATVASFPGGQIQNGTVNSNKFTSATLSWLQSMPVAPGYNLLDSGYSYGSANYVPVADGSGQWVWGTVPMPATMSFDGGLITSDGSGNLAGTSWRGGLLDNGWSSGASGYVPKANGDGTWTWTAASTGSTMNFDSGMITSDGSGNVTAGTVKSGLTDSGYSTGSYGFMPVAMGDGTWTWMAGVTITNTITNTITAYAFSNQFLSSKQIVTYSTNNITWGTSNFLARVNGLYDWTLVGGQLGGGGLVPGTNVDIRLNGSFTGTNAWFVITDGFSTTNTISVAATGAGGGLGNATLFAVDRPELLNRTNYFFGQYVRFDSPKDSADAATKAYVDVSVANIKDVNFSSYTDTNNTLHFIYSRNNFTVFDMASTATYIHIEGLALDGTGTNLLLNAYQTNLASGFTLQSSTNLMLTAGFVTFTNWTTNTVSGMTTFTIPLNFTEPQRFFRIQGSSSSSSSFYGPVAFNGGSLYPSNTWSLATITNGMKSGDIITVNSNGLKLVDVWLSNSVPILKPHW